MARRRDDPPAFSAGPRPYTTTIVQDVADATERIALIKPHKVVSDIEAPGLQRRDAFDLLRRLMFEAGSAATVSNTVERWQRGRAPPEKCNSDACRGFAIWLLIKFDAMLAAAPTPPTLQAEHAGVTSQLWRPMSDSLGLLQWPAMVVTVLASWLVASTSERRRKWGFWVFLISNVLWVLWGWHTSGWALVALQFCLAAMNIRGAFKNAKQSLSDSESVLDPPHNARSAP